MNHIPFVKTFVFLVNFLLFLPGFSQVITTEPEFPTETDVVVVIFDASQGSGGLKGYTGDVYAHTGVITNNSQSPSDWKYVKTDWGENTPETKLTRISGDIYSITIQPNARSYYDVPAGETILKMAFVFRSGEPVGGNYLEGKTEDGGDIFAPIYEPGLQISLNKPIYGYLLPDPGDTIPVEVRGSYCDSLFLYLNDVLISSVAGDSLSQELYADTYGTFRVKAVAKDTVSSVSDSFYYFVRPPVNIAPLPEGAREGINYISGTEVVLCLYAPMKEYCFVPGDFNDWRIDSSSYMNQTPDGNYFWLALSGLEPGKEYIYQYLVDGKIRIGDPYAEKISDPWNDPYITAETYPGMLPYPNGKASGIASILQTEAPGYEWNNPDFIPPAKSTLVVYEMLIRDYTAKHTFQSIIDTLPYLKRLGINALELMPVNEFEGNISWGYNTSYYFAVDKYYGPKNDLKKLVDSCHQNGIAVILDVVYNHSFSTSPYVKLYWDEQYDRPSANSPFYNMTPKHDYNVGYDFNHESSATKKYISRALRYWTEEFRVDGFRFDLSKGFTQNNTLGNVAAWGQYDASRIAILGAYSDTVRKYNPDAFVIMEHFAENSEEQTLSNKGMMLWGNINYAYAEAAMGYNSGSKSDFSAVSYQARGWSNPNLVGYMESHDEERLMYKCSQWGNESGSYSIKETETGLLRMRLDALFFLTIPGPKMIWQFGELGYDFSIDYNGRTGEKPIRWDYYDEQARNELNHFYGALNHLRQRELLFATTDYELDVRGAFKQILLQSNDLNAVVAGNFDVKEMDVTPWFPHTGMWYEYFTGDSLMVGNLESTYPYAPGEYHLFFDKKISNPDFIDVTWKLKSQPGFDFSLVYPNPSTGSFTIAVKPASANETTAVINVFDIAGKRVASFSGKITGYTEIPFSADRYTLRAGVYFIEISTPENSSVTKVTIY